MDHGSATRPVHALDRRRLVRLLRLSRRAAAALPDAIVALDADNRVQWCNASAGRLLGIQWPRDAGAQVAERMPLPAFTRWLQAGAAEPLGELQSPADSSVHLTLRLIRYAPGAALLVARDISHLMRIEQVRRDFVANVSHELRTPLTVVHGYLDMIEPEDVPEYEAILHELRNQSRRMTQIVEDLLTLSRLEASNTLPQERIGMRPLMDALRREAEALSQGAHTIRVEFDGVHDLCGSAKELHSAFSNLVSNAVRYTPPGGRITLQWCSSEAGARLAVSDTGHGIPAQHLPRLTERFYRVDRGRSRAVGGTGLGLAITKHIAMRHDAELLITSEPGKGSVFSLRFPADRIAIAETA